MDESPVHRAGPAGEPCAPGPGAGDGEPAAVGDAALRGGVAFFPAPGRTVVAVSGPDAVRFVDAFTTAHLAVVPPGATREGMLLDGRGQVLALVHLLREEDGVVIDAFPGTAVDIAAHLDRYHIRERLSIVDVSSGVSGCVVAGPAAPAWLAAHAAPVERGAGGTSPASLRIGGIAVRVLTMEGVWPGARLLQMARGDEESLAATIAGLGVPPASAAAVEAVRIEEGFPLPRDIPERTLPQELGRDDRAISFSKGCYLGQETVARIDALGHVNRRLVRLACEGSPPADGAAVHLEQLGAAPEVVGRVGSACHSPRLRSGLALAMVALRGLAAGARLTVEGRAARFVERIGG